MVHIKNVVCPYFSTASSENKMHNLPCLNNSTNFPSPLSNYLSFESATLAQNIQQKLGTCFLGYIFRKFNLTIEKS